MTVVGVDPGVGGALVAVHGGKITAWTDMPTTTANNKTVIDAYRLCDWLIDIGHVDLVVVEHVQGVQGSGATSAFNFGMGVGVIHGLLIALRRPWRAVRPQEWTRALGVGPDKGLHRLEAQRRFPDHAELFIRTKDHGRADAALLALWGSAR